MSRRPASRLLIGWRRVIVAAAVCLALGGLYSYDRQREQRAFDDLAIEGYLLPRDAALEDLVEVRIENFIAENDANALIVMERDAVVGDAVGVGWRLTSPHDLPADPNVMEPWLKNIANARRRNDAPGEPNTGNGLTSPTLRATFRWHERANHPPVTIDFGNQSSYNGQVFGTTSEAPENIFTVSDNIWLRLANNFTVYIDLLIFPLPKEEIVSMTLENESGTTRVEYDAEADKVWLVGYADPGSPAPPDGEEVRTRGDAQVVWIFLRDLGKVRMARPIPGERRDIGEVQLRVSATFKSGETQELRVGDAVSIGDDTYWFAERDDYPATFLIDIETFNGMMWPPIFFRDRNLFSFAPEEVLAYRMLVGHDTVQLRRDSANEPWHLVGKDRRPIRQAYVNQMVAEMAKLRAGNFLTRKPEMEGILFGDGRIAIEADIAVSENELKTERLELSRNPPAPGSEDIHAVTNNESFIYSLRYSVLQKLRPRMEELLDRRIAVGRTDEIFTIEWRKTNADGKGPTEIELTYDKDTGWSAVMERPVPKSGPVDQAIATELLNGLGGLEFDRLMTGGEIEVFDAKGASPLYLLKLSDANGDTIESIAVYDATSNSAEERAAARLGDSSMVRVGPGAFLNVDRFVREQLMPNLQSVERAPSAGPGGGTGSGAGESAGAGNAAP